MDSNTPLRVKEEIEKVSLATNNLFQQLIEIWNVMYEVTPDLILRRLEQFDGYVKEFYADILQSEERKKHELDKQIREKLEERERLKKELEIDIPTKCDKTLPLTKTLAEIEDKLKSFRNIRNARVDKLKVLKTKEDLLCKNLGFSFLPSMKEVPSEKELKKLEDQILELEKEKVKRLDIYVKLKKRILETFKLLEKEPSTTFEKEVCYGMVEEFKMTDENISNLEELDNMVKKQINDAKNEKYEIIKKLEKLWERIKEDDNHKVKFLENHSGVGPETIKELTNEIKRCEEIKYSNMKVFINEVREEIEQWWEKLNYSDEQRSQFSSFFSKLITEEVLDLHESELQKLKQFYENNQLLFELAEKRNELWERMLQLDEAALDKNRLFHNRGGQLLREEKERKMIEINLPKIDKQLQELLSEFVQREGYPFLWKGSNLFDRIITDWEARNNEKELKKLVKKVEHAKMLEIESKMGTTSAQKRKLATTPKTNEEIKDRMQENSQSVPKKRVALKEVNSPLKVHPTTSLSSKSKILSTKRFLSSPRNEKKKTTLRSTPKKTPTSQTTVTRRKLEFKTQRQRKLCFDDSD